MTRKYYGNLVNNINVMQKVQDSAIFHIQYITTFFRKGHWRSNGASSWSWHAWYTLMTLLLNGWSIILYFYGNAYRPPSPPHTKKMKTERDLAFITTFNADSIFNTHTRTQGANFSNILQTAFLYETVFHSFCPLNILICIFLSSYRTFHGFGWAS